MRSHLHALIVAVTFCATGTTLVQPAFSQGGGAEFASSGATGRFGSGDEFSSTAATGTYGETGAGRTGGSFYHDGLNSPPSSIYVPANIYNQSLPSREGHWGCDKNPGDTWIAAGDAFEGSKPYSGFEDDPPPPITGESFNKPAEDAFAPFYYFRSSGRIESNKRRWSIAADQQRVLRVYLSATVEEARGGKVRALIQGCLDQWCAAIGNRLSYTITNDFKNADIYFLQRDTQNREWADNDRRYSKRYGLEVVTVSLLETTVHYLTERRLKSVLLHETGHALGLLEHSPYPSDVMSFSAADVNKPFSALSANDRQQIRTLYELDGPAPVVASLARVQHGQTNK